MVTAGMWVAALAFHALVTAGPPLATSDPHFSFVKAKKATPKKKLTYPDGEHAPRQQELLDYVKEGVLTSIPFYPGRHVSPETWAQWWPWTFASRLTAPVGGLLWLPKILYPDLPDNEAAGQARTLGIIGTVLALIPLWPMVFPVLLAPALIIPVYGWAFWFVVFVVALWATLLFGTPFWILTQSIFPQAVGYAISDAYGQQMLSGSGGGKGKPSKKKTPEGD